MTVNTHTIRASEAAAASELDDTLRAHFDLATDLTDVAGSLLERIGEAAGRARAIHAAAILLARAINDLQACVHLAKLGYAAQVATLVAANLEIAHASIYIGRDEARAAEWFTHDDPKNSYPGSVRTAIRESGAAAGVNAEAIEREYETVYRELCMAKHANPMLVLALGTAPDPNGTGNQITVGPFLTEIARRQIHVALNHALRYLLMMVTSYVRNHVSHDDTRIRYALRLAELSAKQQALVAADADKFSGASPGTQSTNH